MHKKYIILQNVKKNFHNYTLYIFALTFSVALYFSFVTLRYDPAMEEMKEMVNGVAMIQTGSLILVLIVTVFLLYANTLFLKRRSKEIGLYQLIGLTKWKIWWMLSVENFILYIGTFIVGVFLGFAMSKLMMMILLKIIGVEVMIVLSFSLKALLQTAIVFALMYVFILLMNHVFIRRQNILGLFQLSSDREEQIQHISAFTIVGGIVGVFLIGLGYVLSSRLFSGDFAGYMLFYAMFSIVVSVTIGTYLFYKNSLRLFFHVHRRRKNGYVALNDVLSLSVIMFRMRSNAFLLTVITLVSTLAIGLSSLAYIGYHSAEQTVKQIVPHHFSIFETEEAEAFTMKLAENNISYTVDELEIIYVYVDVTEMLVSGSYDNLDISDDPRLILPVISDQSIDHINVPVDEVVLTKPVDAIEAMLEVNDVGNVTFLSKDLRITKRFSVVNQSVLPMRLTEGLSAVIVHEDVYKRLEEKIDKSIQREYPVYMGINIKHAYQLGKANEFFHELQLNKWTGRWESFESQLEILTFQKQGMGLNIFIAGFLGLIFLITSGCILYFKQMNECEEEKGHYTILQKLGFTEEDLLRGIRKKQLINFGIPLVVGLLHSYFAIKSGWFIFGTEMWTPMLIVMFVYTGLYSVFGYMSIEHYKRVIRNAL